MPTTSDTIERLEEAERELRELKETIANSERDQEKRDTEQEQKEREREQNIRKAEAEREQRERDRERYANEAESERIRREEAKQKQEAEKREKEEAKLYGPLTPRFPAPRVGERVDGGDGKGGNDKNIPSNALKSEMEWLDSNYNSGIYTLKWQFDKGKTVERILLTVRYSWRSQTITVTDVRIVEVLK